MKLNALNKNVFGHVWNNLDRLQKHLEWLLLQSAMPEVIAFMRETRVELNCWRGKAKSMWHQRSKLSWINWEIRTQVIFTQRHHHGFKQISLGALWIQMTTRLKIKGMWRMWLSNTIQIYLNHPIQQNLKKFYLLFSLKCLHPWIISLHVTFKRVRYVKL